MNPVRDVSAKMFEGATLKAGEYVLLWGYSVSNKVVVAVLILLHAKKKGKGK